MLVVSLGSTILDIHFPEQETSRVLGLGVVLGSFGCFCCLFGFFYRSVLTEVFPVHVEQNPQNSGSGLA